MRIATWNLQSDKPLHQEREALFRREINKVNADVWVHTETWKHFLPGEGYRLAAESSQAKDLTPADRRWVAIWVRSDFEARRQEVQGQPDRMVCVQIKKPGQRSIVVIGTVLPSPGDRRYPTAVDFCSALTAQTIEWEPLWGTPRSNIFLVAGDFNQSLPRQGNFGSIKGELAVLDALKRHDLFCLTPGNVSLTNKPRIDHICVSRNGIQPPFLPQAGAWEAPCIGEKEITDHSGTFADLDLPEFP
ncbi:MAG: endonuclease/exonuclease/phosphatase family protein [Planctomycetota bacterium]